MAIRIRVLPQPGSIGAQRNTIARQSAQISNLRLQVQQLRAQLAAVSVQQSPYGYAPQPQMPYVQQQPYVTQQPYDALAGLLSLGVGGGRWGGGFSFGW